MGRYCKCRASEWTLEEQSEIVLDMSHVSNVKPQDYADDVSFRAEVFELQPIHLLAGGILFRSSQLMTIP